MVGRNLEHGKEFRELSFAEQAASITATIDELEAAIEHHVARSPRPSETIAAFLARVERLRQRLRVESPGSPRPLPDAESPRRVRVLSPRLADPARAADFVMDVAEEGPDAGLR